MQVFRLGTTQFQNRDFGVHTCELPLGHRNASHFNPRLSSKPGAQILPLSLEVQLNRVLLVLMREERARMTLEFKARVVKLVLEEGKFRDQGPRTWMRRAAPWKPG
ncbi:hypothetical protein HUW62_22620 [Myxococcus sp. AM011]|uniref:hypothetical protein n=1 Tax=Myxococcus sp. AM011 TaxID=2745200 RepID=UPI001595D0DF|nr:hypothetical protein [Myxococcus sp. AM011]NVJ24026.1 hypothetical protein [Myxococcus sp. AM011]